MIVGMMGAALLLSILLLVGYGFAATMIPFWLLNGPVLLVLLIGSVLVAQLLSKENFGS